MHTKILASCDYSTQTNDDQCLQAAAPSRIALTASWIIDRLNHQEWSGSRIDAVNIPRRIRVNLVRLASLLTLYMGKETRALHKDLVDFTHGYA
jgi:hypothetical protein